MTDLMDLLERCEQASEPNRRLDAEIAVAFNYGCLEGAVKFLLDDVSDTNSGWVGHKFNGGFSAQIAPKFTGSIDAISQILPDTWTHMEICKPDEEHNGWTVHLIDAHDVDNSVTGFSKTYILALCVVALEARIKSIG